MPLTCICCKLLFSVPELHHEHYKSDWHRYNLKRRIAELPPVTKEDFDERAAAFQASNKEKERISLSCNTCDKHFSSKNAMVNHLKSKRHKEATSAYPNQDSKRRTYVGGSKQLSEYKEPVKEQKSDDEHDQEWTDDGEWESCDDDDDECMRKVVVDTNDCLFCDHQSDSTEHNVAHMTEVHSFFIPDIEYLSDLDGLIALLAGKINLGYFCLWCDRKGKKFKSTHSVKQHMIDKGHCKMLYEGEVMFEFSDFYDYSSCDVQEESYDEKAVNDLLENSDYELVLPSGATVGHRSLSLYYKQNLKPVNTDKKKVKSILQHYKSLGYTGSSGEAAVKKARDIMFMQRIKSRYNLKIGMKNNKLQPHFRSQVQF